MCVQSSAGKSALHTMSPREARNFSGVSARSRPGMRKNGATLAGSPSAAPTDAMPSSTSFCTCSADMRWKRSGWFWLCVPMVWPAS